MKRRAGRWMRTRGVSLLELLAVLVILAGVAVVAYPRLGGVTARSKVQTAAVQLSAQLKATRLAAIARNGVERFAIDTAARTFWSSVDPTVRSIDSNVSTVDCGAEVGRDATRVVIIPFHPDGSARDCSIELEAAGQTVRLRVDWLTGAAGIVAGAR